MNRTISSYLVTAIFLILSFSNCATSQNETRLPKEPTIVIDRLSIWAEPSIQNSADIDSLVKQMIQYRAFLTKNLFNDSSIVPIRVALYKNRESYSRSRPTQIESLAHFNLATQTIHVRVNAPSEVWRHEFIHAILYQKSKQYPFWIQEGVSLLFQSIPPSDLSFCQVDVKLPFSLHRFQNDLLEDRLRIPIPEQKNFGREDIFYDTILSAYFAFFLYQRQELLTLIQNMPKSNQTAFLLLLNGNYESLEKLETEFYTWLATNQPRKSRRNC